MVVGMSSIARLSHGHDEETHGHQTPDHGGQAHDPGESRSASNGSAASNGYSTATKPGRIRSKARREAIEALIERTTKDQGLSPELKARLKDDAWGKRLVDP
jgi:hypothetical protein